MNTFRLVHDRARELALEAVKNAPFGWRVKLSPPVRKDEHSALMWSRLTDIAKQVQWYGQNLTKEDWKEMLSASLKSQRVVPGIDANTFVVLGARTREMSPAEMSDMVLLCEAFGSERNVRWSLNEYEVGGAPNPASSIGAASERSGGLGLSGAASPGGRG